MQQEHHFRPGDEVQAQSTGRRMTVRSVTPQGVLCAWFDGRTMREVTLPPSRVRATGATRDTEVVKI